MARGRIGDLLHNQTWPPRISPGPSTDGATTGGITNDEGKALQITDSYSYGCFFFQIVKRDLYWTSHFRAIHENTSIPKNLETIFLRNSNTKIHAQFFPKNITCIFFIFITISNKYSTKKCN